MSELYLTAYEGKILGPIAKLLGWIMDKIYYFLENVLHIQNGPLIAITIFIFTILVYMCMFPLTYKQQKFSMLQRKMQPEMKAIQDKYAGKRDQASQMALQEEMQTLYDKYGISPTGSCLQLIIQMPIFFALYRVFYNVPAYINSVKDIYSNLVTGIMATDGYAQLMQNVFENAKVNNILRVDFLSTDVSTHANYIVDVLYKLNADGWANISSTFPNLAEEVVKVTDKLSVVNYLFLLDLSDTPWNMLKTAIFSDEKNIMLAICAILLPLISYGSQVLSIKLMPQVADNNGNDQMAAQMKMMNNIMPLFSLFITFTTPAGLGVYWIAGALVRTVQQFFLNKHFEKVNLDDLIEKNKEIAIKKKEKRGIRQAQIYQAATANTKKSMSDKANISSAKADALNRAAEARENAGKSSMAAKANMVKKFNEVNNK